MTANEEVPVSAPYTPSEKALDISPDQNGGVLKEIITEGHDDALPPHGSTVSVHYEGKLTDGTVFDSSKASGVPFEFALGVGKVIKAWDIGVATMKRGEVAVLTCKPEYAYDSRGVPGKIPPDATLIFEISLISWEPEDLSKGKNGGILRTETLVVGKGYSSPFAGALVEVHLTGKYEEKIFEDRDISFELDEGCEHGVIHGVERALKSFKKGEKSVLLIKPQYAFMEEGHKEFGIPPNATVQYTVELKDFEQPKTTWDMTTEQKLSQAKLLKEKATNYFKAEKYPMALKFYNRLVKCISTDAGFKEEEEEERKTLLLAGRLNLGLVHLKMNHCYKAKQECDSALEIDPKNVKGFFRRGQAYLAMGEHEKAKKDFEEVLKIEPHNKSAVSQIAVCCNGMKQYREKEKKIYANMFEKFARRDKEECATRYGWWDDKNKQPIIAEVEPIDQESIEAAKAEKRKQLENLKKLAKAKKEERERERNMENAAPEETTKSESDTPVAESSDES